MIELGLAPAGFNLNDISNVVWRKFDVSGGIIGLTLLLPPTVDASLHIAFHELELFALTVSSKFGEKIKKFLEADLARRQAVLDSIGLLPLRPFQVRRIEPSLLMNISSC